MKKLLKLIVALGVLALAVWAVAIFTRAKSPLSGDVANDPELIKRGQQVAIQGDCTACHTAPNGGAQLAGGYAFPIPFMGTVYSPNITSDAQHGIGNWTLAEFDEAVRFGVSKRTGNLYPAMPYVSYAKVSDDDMKALYAYFKYGVKPETEASKKSTIPWPLDIRWPVQIWNDMFAPTKTYVADNSQSEQWNRGAYLVQGLTHCGTCHTPRGLLMQEVALDHTRQGYLGGSKLGGWLAFNITSDVNAGIGTWTEEQIVTFLRTGNVKGLAQAAGGMAEAVQHSFSKMSPDDIAAIATYIKTVPAYNKDGENKPRSSYGEPSLMVNAVRGTDDTISVKSDPTMPTTYKGGYTETVKTSSDPRLQMARAETIYLGACATCHQASGAGTADGYYPSMIKNSAVGVSDASNLTQVILHGLNRDTPDDNVLMPGFGGQLSDAEVAALVSYVSTTFGNGKASITAEEVKKLR